MIRGLPYDAELEYLESTGTEYINTGVILDSTYGIDISFAPMEGLPGTGITEHGIFGSSTSGSTHNVLQIHTSYGGVGLWMPGSTRIAVCLITTELGIPQHWQINLANSGSVLINGTASGSTRPATSTACPYPVYLFARDVANSVKSNSYSKMRLYSWTVTDASGNIIQQLIPVRVGSGASAVGYMYDRVSKRLFGNAGSGAFVLGPDKAVPVLSLHRYASPSNGVAFGKMGVGATMLNGWKNPYITDGLIAMWDGEWNVGGGVHDPNATAWKDLIGNRDWTLGTSTSYEWTANSFDAKDQFAATQGFIDGNLVKTVEVCAKIKMPSSIPQFNTAFIIIGRQTSSGPYYGLLYRFPATFNPSLMGGRSFFEGTYNSFVGVGATFSFPDFATAGVDGYFNGEAQTASGSNTLDYNATTRGTVARIGGTAQQSMPIEVYNIRLYSRALTAAEIAANYAIDKARFNLPDAS